MRCILSSTLVCALALSSIGSAQKGQAEKPDPDAKPVISKTQNWRIVPVSVGRRDPSQYVPYSDFFPASGSVAVNVAGTPSYDSAGASCNVRLTISVPSGKDAMSGIGWDVTLTATAPSWLSEIAVLITNVNGEGYVLRPGASDTFGGTGSYTSGGVNDLCTVYNLPPLALPDGNLYLEFFETYDDFSDCVQDGNWDSGTLTFAFAATPPFTGYNEQGDAGDLPETAQATPSGALTGIRGTVTPSDADMYAIYISNPSTFSASTRCNALFDTQLSLFDANGRGVSFNDDSPLGGLASSLDGSCIPGPGLYYLVVTAFDRDPAGCNGGEIWADTPYGVIRCPDGSEPTSRISGWTGSHGVSATYIVELTGATGANPGDPADCPPFQGWDEFANGGGDAGDLPETSQSTGNASIPVIRGQMDASDVDMYAIYIENPSTFSASTIGGATWDTQLWLFDANGKGVVANDDSAGLQSRIDNTAGCITQPGVYYLAISRFARNAAGCEGGGIWAGRTNNCPNGAEPNSRVASWFNSTASAGEYRIFLTGVRGATRGDPADCPPPGQDQWDELANGGGDAGDLPNNAQAVYASDRTPCQSPVTRITGSRAATDDADMYAICITDPASFVASSAGSGFDTQLWLFRCDGTGVVHNDDFGGLQSRIDNTTNCLNGLQAGTYLLAITGYDQDAVDSNGNPLWNDTPFSAIRCPDGSGAANPMVGWSGTGGSGAYRITLTGAYFVSQNGCGPSCQGDANRDGRVDDADLLIVLFQFGQSGFGLQGDVDNNGTVDDAD
ncbi:MAG: DVUA0089 family protein, partial [Fimbriimonadales bacterium]|nr:DVUA0089 family protein [Fimbriimonadales bacterium]